MIVNVLRIAMVLDMIAFIGLLAADMMFMGCDEKQDGRLFMLTVLSIAFLLVGAFCLDYRVFG